MKFDTPAGINPIDRRKAVGHPLDRVEGRLKTTGTAPYTSDCRSHDPEEEPPATRTVVVRGEKFELAVERKSKSVWRVSGTYKGRLLRWEGRSVNIAAARWRDHAHISTL